MVSVVVVEEDVDIEVSLVVVDVLLLEVTDDVEVVALVRPSAKYVAVPAAATMITTMTTRMVVEIPWILLLMLNLRLSR